MLHSTHRPTTNPQPNPKDNPVTLDFSKLVVKDSSEILRNRSGAGRPAGDNPFQDHIVASWNERTSDDAKMGKTKILTVAVDERNEKGTPLAVVTISGLLRRAADDNNLGVRINHREINEGKKVEILFVAKEKTLRPRKSDDVVPDDVSGIVENEPAY